MDGKGPRRKRRRLSTEDELPITSNNEVVQNETDIQAVPDGQKQQTQQLRSLFIRSLPSTTTTESLTEHFSQSYPLKHATVVLDPTTKQSKGYGFITFVDAEDAQKAKEEFNGSLLEGRKIKVEVAEPRHRDLDNDGMKGKPSQPTARAIASKAERERLKSENQKPPKLIVRNLPWSIKDSEQLALLFRSYGKVKFATIPKPKTGLSAGFGFVTLRGRKNAEKALAGVNGKEIDGRTLAVDWAVEKDVWQAFQKGDDDENSPKLASGKPSELPQQDNASAVKPKDDDEMQSDEFSLSDTGHEDSSSKDDDGYDDDYDEDDEGLDDEKASIKQQSAQDQLTTIFIRNLPFNTTDEMLLEHFKAFGPIRYARVVLDATTRWPKGTGFVCFFNSEDAISCLREAPRLQTTPVNSSKKGNNTALSKHSVLEDMHSDRTGRYSLEGRVLHISPAVDRNEANRLAVQGSSVRDTRDKDKRRFFLLSEGTVPSDSPLYSLLAPSEIKMREESAKQRQLLMKNNPSLHLSLTRLSVRNIPRSITSKDLKALAREGVVGFARDVKTGARRQLSKEELSRGGDEMRDAEKARKVKGKGIVKQAKIVFEGREGGKVAEDSGAGRSRGYGFIEYVSHRWALMGLRWLNGHAVGQPRENDRVRKGIDERKKRLIVEFAIENAQVVARRQDREAKAREASRVVAEKKEKGEIPHIAKKILSKDSLMAQSRRSMKRKRGADVGQQQDPASKTKGGSSSPDVTKPLEKAAKRQQIIGRKRMLRKARKAT